MSAAKCINVGGRETDENGNYFIITEREISRIFKMRSKKEKIITSSDKELVIYDMIVIFM